MLTSAARETLAGVQTVIVDEVHAVAAHQTRRAPGAVAGTARRSCWTSPRSASGCRRPCARPRRWPGSCPGRRPTTIVAPPAAKTFDLSVQVPVPDMANLENNTIWPDVEERIVDLIEAHSSLDRVRQLAAAGRATYRPGSTRFTPNGPGSNCVRHRNPQVAGGPPAHIMGSGQTYGADAAAGPRPPRLGQQGAARRRSRTTSRAGGSRRSSPPPAWNSASTWARSTW